MVLDPVRTLDDLPVPRRVAIQTLFRDIHQGEGDLAALYAAFAARPGPAPLRAGLEALSAAKRAQVEALTALAPLLGNGSEDGAAPGAPTAVAARPELFSRAFATERDLEAWYREVLTLLGDPTRCPELARVAAETARHRGRILKLYLKYS
jgi:hypothetical protein